MRRRRAMARRARRKFTAEQKAAILRRHIKEKVPISDLCDEYNIQPSAIHTWMNNLLENMHIVLEHGSKRRRVSRETRLERKISSLQEKLNQKDSVIAEISEEYVRLKKELGEP